MRFQTVHTPTSLTEGPISQALISFALPLLLGNLFQQLYNTADSLIVGNFLGSEALAAVSSSGNLIFLMVGLVNGVSMGAGVVIARYFGAKDYDRIQKTIHTLLAFGLVAGALLTIVGVALSPVMLRLMDTPETVLPDSISYFRTYFTGSLAFVLYNICMGILQAVGDSRHPLQYRASQNRTAPCPALHSRCRPAHHPADRHPTAFPSCSDYAQAYKHLGHVWKDGQA